MIKQLYLRNFRRFDTLNLDFTGGVNGVFGPNYRGKSTVLLAIAVALAGPAWARGRNLVRRGEKSFEIQLLLELDGAEYRIMRSKSGASLHKGDELLANQQTNVNIALTKLLGMSPARFLELRFIQQKEASAMFEAGAAKLNTLVEELSGVRTISHVIDRLTDRIRTTTARADVLRERSVGKNELDEMVQRIEELKTHHAAVTQELETATKQAGEWEDRLPALADRRKKYESELAELHNHMSHRTVLEGVLRGAEEKLKSTYIHVADPVKLESAISESEASLAECGEWISEYRHLHSSLNAATQRMRTLHDREPKVEGDLAELTAAEATLTSEVQALDQDHSDAQVHYRAARKQANDLEQAIADGVCRGCNRPFDDHADVDAEKAKLVELRGLESKAESHASKLGKALTDKRSELDRASRGVTLVSKQSDAREVWEADEAQAALAQKDAQTALDAQLAMIDTDAETFMEEVEGLKSDLVKMRKDHTEAVKADADRAQAESAVQSAKSALEALPEVDEKALVGLQAEVEQAQAAYAECQRKLTEATTSLPLLRRQLDTLQADADQRAKQLQEAYNANEEADVTFQQLTSLEGLRKYLRDNRSRYLQAAWDIMLDRASMFASTVTENHISRLTRTEGGEFEFEEQGEAAAVADASGAQAAILGMAVQTALAEVLPTPLDLLLADEPAADMDADHSGAAMMALSTLTKQAVVISHHRMDESLCAKVVEL